MDHGMPAVIQGDDLCLYFQRNIFGKIVIFCIDYGIFKLII